MENSSQKAVAHNPASFFSLINHPLKFRLYLLKKLPAAFFSGLKIERAGRDACTVSVPFRWLTQNPFRSTYFASLSMAAELSTGVLAMAQVHGRKPGVSMLVSAIEGRFYKKATSKTFFTCTDGALIAAAVEQATATGESHEAKAHSIGLNSAGDVVAEFWLTWSFKRKG